MAILHKTPSNTEKKILDRQFGWDNTQSGNPEFHAGSWLLAQQSQVVSRFLQPENVKWQKFKSNSLFFQTQTHIFVFNYLSFKTTFIRLLVTRLARAAAVRTHQRPSEVGCLHKRQAFSQPIAYTKVQNF